MQPTNKTNQFIKFLKDDKFIEWKLCPTDELQTYWDEFLRQNPEEEAHFRLAEIHFSRIKLSSWQLSSEKKRKATERLIKSLHTHRKRRNLNHMVYIAAAFAALLIITILYMQRNSTPSMIHPGTPSDYIVGNELESQDILFMTGNGTTSFQEDVDIEIKQGEKAEIKGSSQGEKVILMAEHTMNKLVVPYGKRSRLTLPDGTQVWLNSGSILEFPSSFTGDTRRVSLSGEMYIEVVHNTEKAFVVETSGFAVQVFGTSFNVSSYRGNHPSVVLVEGSVGLTSATTRKELILVPNEQAILSDEGFFDKKTVNTELFTSWKDGYLTFNDTPVSEALKQIERYYNLLFNFGENVALDGLTCTGKIILSDNLDNVMTALSLISSTGYKKEDKTIYIYKNDD